MKIMQSAEINMFYARNAHTFDTNISRYGHVYYLKAVDKLAYKLIFISSVMYGKNSGR